MIFTNLHSTIIVIEPERVDYYVSMSDKFTFNYYGN